MSSTSPLRRVCLALLGACCSALILVSLAGANDGGNFILGDLNTAASTTRLDSTGSFGLLVIDSSAFTTAVRGDASAVTGTNTGVSGTSASSTALSYGVIGGLTSNSPGSPSAAVLGTSSSMTANGPGVYGRHYYDSGTAPGVVGETNSTDGGAVGTQGTVTSTNPGPGAAAVRGVNNGAGGYGIGVWGSHAGYGYGVYGTSANGYGVVGLHEGTYGPSPGVWGETNGTGANAIGVLGDVTANPAGPGSVGVRGINSGTGSYGIGVWGSQAGSGYGVYGTAPTGFGVVGESASGWAGYFNGNVYVNGTLSKAAGGFKIDHPLDPAHKYLQHSFVESPQMMNVYNGIATTDGKGFATVRLPGYFQALNRTFRYQLTIVGSRGWRARVVKEIAHNRFTIQSDLPRVRVSWQVTGVRHDPYANAHRIKVVEQKPAAEQGRYLQPGLYGQPRSKGELVPPRGAKLPRKADWQSRGWRR
jgi:hypothetical protein